jgi:hypothetical protein
MLLNIALACMQRGVPGFSQAALSTLQMERIRAISVGVDPSSAPPDVPLNTPFIWRSERDNSQLIAMWHPFGYGGHSIAADGTTVLITPPKDCVHSPKINATSERAILCFSWRGTNAGPFRDPDDVLRVFAQARAAFPGATVKASTLEAFVDALEPHVESFPVVTGEIGDTWIHGVASDPSKMKQYRAIMRMRSQCLLSESCTAQVRPKAPSAETSLVAAGNTLLKYSQHRLSRTIALQQQGMATYAVFVCILSGLRTTCSIVLRTMTSHSPHAARLLQVVHVMVANQYIHIIDRHNLHPLE